MNFLLGALLLVLLLLPGFIFRLGYLAKAFSNKSFHASFLEELIFSLLPAFFLETLGYLIVKNFRTPCLSQFKMPGYTGINSHFNSINKAWL